MWATMDKDMLYRYGVPAVHLVFAGAVLASLAFGAPSVLIQGLVWTASAFGIIASWWHPRSAAALFVVLYLVTSYHHDSREALTVLGGMVAVGLVVGRAGQLGLGFGYALVLCYLAITEPFSGIYWPHEFDETVVALALFFAAISVGAYMRHAEQRHADQERKAEEAKKRQRDAMVKTLHDSVAATLTSSVMRAEGARFNPDIPEGLKAELELIAAENRKAIEEVRELIRVLRSDALEIPDEVQTLRDQVDSFVELLRSHGFTVVVDRDDSVPLGVYERQLIALPILKELASNVMKYGVPGSDVRLTITAVRGGIQVGVRNEIAETRSPSYMSTGLGLQQIRQAVAAEGGEFTSHPEGDTWVVRWFIPAR